MIRRVVHILALGSISLWLTNCSEDDVANSVTPVVENPYVQSNDHGLNIRFTFTNAFTSLNYITSPHFVIWWGNDRGDLRPASRLILHNLEQAWSLAIDQYGLIPPDDWDTYYTNIYLSGSGNGVPGSTGNQIRQDGFGNPYLLIDPELYDYLNRIGVAGNLPNMDIAYLAFLMFQQDRPSPTLSTNAYDIWFLLSSAGWFTHELYPDLTSDLELVAAYALNPQLPLWTDRSTLSFHYPDYDGNWSQVNHDVGAKLFLIYLTDHGIVSAQDLISIYKTSTDQLAIEHLMALIEANGMNAKQVFADFAAHNTVWDYNNDAQFFADRYEALMSTALQEGWNVSITDTIPETGTDGWLENNPQTAPGGWAYNVYTINNPKEAYDINLEFDPKGSQDSASEFKAMIVRSHNGQHSYRPMEMVNPTSASIQVTGVNNEERVFIVVVSVPDNYTGYETYSYRFNINPI